MPDVISKTMASPIENQEKNHPGPGNWAVVWRSICYFVNRFIFRKRKLEARASVAGLRLRFFAADDVGRKIYKYGLHEPMILDFISRCTNLQTKRLFMDVGANLGWYSLLLSRLGSSNIRIYSFEPDPCNFNLLQENLALNGVENVQTFQQGLSDKPGQQILHLYGPNNLGMHSLSRSRKHRDSISVPLTTLDEFCQRHGLESATVDLLKLDAEGHEGQILEGARKTLERVGSLILEFSPEFYDRNTAGRIIQLLTIAGLKPYLITNQGGKAVSGTELLNLKTQQDTVWLKHSLAN